jgi:hypothetical protein
MMTKPWLIKCSWKDGIREVLAVQLDMTRKVAISLDSPVRSSPEEQSVRAETY